MNYYDNIKQELINNEIYKKVKDYSKNRNDLETYYKVGKILFDAGKHYGDSIIKEYSKRLTSEIGKGYSWRNLYNMRLFYIEYDKLQPLAANLTWTNLSILLSIKDENKRKYYINECIKNNLSKRNLIEKIKLKEYERLDKNTKLKLSLNKEKKIEDLIKNPIVIKAEYIGQIKKYMNYVDKNIRKINMNQTIGIIICKKENDFVMEYCSDDRIFSSKYILI